MSTSDIIPLQPLPNIPGSQFGEIVFEALDQRLKIPEDPRLSQSFTLSAAHSRSTSVDNGLGESVPLLENTQPEDNSTSHSQRSETEPIARFVILPP